MATSRRARARRGRRRKRREDVLDAGTGAEARRLTFGVSTAWSVRAKEGDSMRGRAKKLEFFSTWTYVVLEIHYFVTDFHTKVARTSTFHTVFCVKAPIISHALPSSNR